MFELTDGFADVVALSVFFEGGHQIGGFFEGGFEGHYEELGRGRGGRCVEVVVCSGGRDMMWMWEE